MCIELYNVTTGKTVNTVGELANLIKDKTRIIRSKTYQAAVHLTLKDECCLCPINVEATLRSNGYVFHKRGTDHMTYNFWKDDKISEA